MNQAALPDGPTLMQGLLIFERQQSTGWGRPPRLMRHNPVSHLGGLSTPNRNVWFSPKYKCLVFEFGLLWSLSFRGVKESSRGSGTVIIGGDLYY
jgi:hypothetical protein